MSEIARVIIYLFTGLGFVISATWLSSKLTPTPAMQINVVGIEKLLDEVAVLREENAELKKDNEEWIHDYWQVDCEYQALVGGFNNEHCYD